MSETNQLANMKELTSPFRAGLKPYFYLDERDTMGSFSPLAFRFTQEMAIFPTNRITIIYTILIWLMAFRIYEKRDQ
jgi:hypothetical protein